MTQWLYRRLRAEDPSIDPSHSRRGTLNYFKALSLLCSTGFSDEELAAFYSSKVTRRKVNPKADTLAFENMLMALHELSALQAMSRRGQNSYDLIRSAIVSWYYGIYCAGSAMIAAKDGGNQQDHTGTANAWDNHIAKANYVPTPFALRVTTLIKSDYEAEISTLRPGVEYSLHDAAQDRDQALEVYLSHLKGTATWWRENREAMIKKKNKIPNFRKKEHRELRDQQLQKQSLGFMHQAFRYRGKAHYRDAIYLAYGDNQAEQQIQDLSDDLYTTLSCYIRMASHYCSRRVEKSTWSQFLNDLSKNSLLSHDLDVLKGSG